MHGEEALAKILTFLKKIDIPVIERSLSDTTFLPGLDLGPGCIYVDYLKLKYPGDMLHEAGHLAVTPGTQRRAIGSPELEQPWPPKGEEIGTVLWTYAASLEIGLPLNVVFHPDGYKNDSAWLIETFESGAYIGLPFLEWAGLCYGPQRAQDLGTSAFPAMIKWVRD